MSIGNSEPRTELLIKIRTNDFNYFSEELNRQVYGSDEQFYEPYYIFDSMNEKL